MHARDQANEHMGLEQAVLDAVKNAPHRTSAELAEMLHEDPDAVQMALCRLVVHDQVDHSGRNAAGRPLYCRPDTRFIRSDQHTLRQLIVAGNLMATHLQLKAVDARDRELAKTWELVATEMGKQMEGLQCG